MNFYIEHTDLSFALYFHRNKSQDDILWINKQINQLKIEQLKQLEQIKNCIVIFLKPQNRSSTFILERIFCWSALKPNSRIVHRSKSIYLPPFIFENLPKIHTAAITIENSEDIKRLGPHHHEVFSNLTEYYYSFDRFKFYRSSKNPLDWLLSICSIKKIMQYLWFRTYKDLNSD